MVFNFRPDKHFEMNLLGRTRGQGEDVQIFSGFDFDEEQTKKIEERHNDLIELEKSLLELNEIFNEMAVMVESQE